MNILIIGVSGFVGRHLYHQLSQKGFHVIGCSRNKVTNINWQEFSFNQGEATWSSQLKDIDLVINTAGIYKQNKNNTFLQIHDIGPRKLFSTCNKYKIKVIQISAIGAELERPVSEFLTSKRNADQALLKYDAANIVIYPGIILGEGGTTTRQLSLLARSWIMPLVFGRNKTLPLISIYQLTNYIIEQINHWPKTSKTKVLIAKKETMENCLNNVRQWMGYSKGIFIAIPSALINFVFLLLPKMSIGAFNKQSIDMFNSYSNNTIETVEKVSASSSLQTNKPTTLFLQHINMTILFYINMITLSVIWIMSGVSSIINFDQSKELLLMIGLKGNIGEITIYVAAIGDIILGLLLYISKIRRNVIFMQLVIVLFYSVIISIFMPTLLLHPFTPIIKNMAVVVLSLYLLTEQQE